MATAATQSNGKAILLRIAELRAWVFLILLIVFFEVWSRAAYDVTFIFNPYNIKAITVAATAPLVLALGQTFVIISAGIDLSLGFVMGFASVIAAHMANYAAAQLGLPPFPAMLFGVLSGVGMTLIPGLVNGWLIAQLKVPPFIGTLGMYGVARGSAYLIAGGMTIAISNPWYSTIGNDRVLGVPVLVILAAICCVVLHYMLSQTAWPAPTPWAPAKRRPAAPGSISRN
jgi:ribose transport system permease protein